MKTSSLLYKGNLQTEITHIKSSSSYMTDAPTDNNGKGSDFSPTDLVATSLASCMLTVIGIYCDQNDIEFSHGKADVHKKMGNNPRRIIEIAISMDLSNNNFNKKQELIVERVARNCPVANSLDKNINQILTVKF